MSPDEYMDLLVQRREDYYAEHGQPAPGFPALPEWFIRDGDEHLVDMDAIEQANRAEQPRPERKPRNYKPASHWREVLERIDARLAALDPGPRHGTTDPAAHGGIGIRQTPRQQRAWGDRIDKTAAEHVRLTRRRAEVAARLARAEKRETWTCQACSGPCPAGDVLCTSCGQNRRSTPVDNEGMV